MKSHHCLTVNVYQDIKEIRVIIDYPLKNKPQSHHMRVFLKRCNIFFNFIIAIIYLFILTFSFNFYARVFWGAGGASYSQSSALA